MEWGIVKRVATTMESLSCNFIPVGIILSPLSSILSFPFVKRR